MRSSRPGHPPAWARRLVERIVTGPQREFVLGDLEEMYARRLRGAGRVVATLAYLTWGARSGLSGWTADVSAGLAGDFRSAFRQFSHHPRVYLVGSLVLAVGLGVATASWGLRYGVLGRGLPVSEPDRILGLSLVDPRTREVRSGFTLTDLEIIRSSAPTLELVALWGGAPRVTFADGIAPPARVEAIRATPSFFRLLEFTPRHGRVLTDGDVASTDRVAVVSYDFWARRYDEDPGVVGRIVEIDGRATTIVGVLDAASYMHAESVWLPVRVENRDAGYDLIARAAAGWSTDDISSALAPLGRRLTAGTAEPTREMELRALPFPASLYQEDVYLSVVTRAGGLLFLMAVANVAGLFAVRARGRATELRLRRALGASRLRILRQLFVEAAIPAATAILGGALIASAALDWYESASHSYAGARLPVWYWFSLGTPHYVVLGGGAALSTIAISLLAGMPELGRTGEIASREGRGASGGRFRLGKALAAVEIGAGGALLLLASLMIHSAVNLYTEDWGFARESVMTGHVVLDGVAYPESERLSFWEDLEDEVAAIPGVQSAALATQLPMVRYAGEWGAVRRIEVEGWQQDDPERLPEHYVDAVTPSFFETFEAPVVTGRGFDAGDEASATPVALVNTHFARAYFADRSALGQRLRVWSGSEPGPWRRIVGVAPHLWMDTDENQEPEGLYIPLAQAGPPEASIALRVRGAPEQYATALREAVWELGPDLAVTNVMTMPELIRWRTRLYRRDGPPFIWIGVTAFVLAVVGLYAVLSFIASTRTREFGIRAALGAGHGDLLGRSVLEGVPAIVAGLAGGALVGLWLTRDFSRFMFDVDPSSPGTMLVSFGTLVSASLTASLLPAMRVRRLDLVRVLKAE